MHKRIAALLILLTAAVAACAAPGYNDDYGPEIVLDDAAHAFVDGFNRHDLTQFDSYFAPPDVADPDGLLHSQALAHQLLASAPANATLKLDEWKITNDYTLLEGDPVISYRATVSLWQGETQLWTNNVSQDVSFHQMPDGLWKVASADPPVINGRSAAPPAPAADVPAGWKTTMTDWYRVSYPPQDYHVYETDPGLSLITLEPTTDLQQRSADTTLYRITVAAHPHDTPAAVSGAYDPAQLFGHGPVLTYGPEQIQDLPIQETSLDGAPAYRVDNLGGLGVTTDMVALRHDVLFEIVIEPYLQENVNPHGDLPLVEQIVNTFQYAP